LVARYQRLPDKNKGKLRFPNAKKPFWHKETVISWFATPWKVLPKDEFVLKGRNPRKAKNTDRSKSRLPSFIVIGSPFKVALVGMSILRAKGRASRFAGKFLLPLRH